MKSNHLKFKGPCGIRSWFFSTFTRDNWPQICDKFLTLRQINLSPQSYVTSLDSNISVQSGAEDSALVQSELWLSSDSTSRMKCCSFISNQQFNLTSLTFFSLGYNLLSRWRRVVRLYGYVTQRHNALRALEGSTRSTSHFIATVSLASAQRNVGGILNQGSSQFTVMAREIKLTQTEIRFQLICEKWRHTL